MKTQDALYNYCLRLADNNMILAQRLAEWCSFGPILEEDLALTNMSLDLLGQAESMYDYAASFQKNKSADDLAFLRSEREYLNNLLVEQPNGDFAFTMMKQVLFSAYTKHLYEILISANDETIKGLAAKAIKEVRYHLRHSSEWIIRMGKGTVESKERSQHALNELWRFTDDMFECNETDRELIASGVIPETEAVYKRWKETVVELMLMADLKIPDTGHVIKGGYNGIHTEHLGHMLCEMQYLQRAHPGASW